jgi:hypothetical protein
MAPVLPIHTNPAQRKMGETVSRCVDFMSLCNSNLFGFPRACEMVQVELFHLRDGRRELAAHMRHLQNLLICLFAHCCRVELGERLARVDNDPSRRIEKHYFGLVE